MSAAVAVLANSDLSSALADARTRYVTGRPKSEALHREALRVLPGGNTRSVLAYDPFPTAMARGEDCRLWDVDGHAYLDLCGEYTAGLFGHSEPRIRKALSVAMEGGLNLAAVGEAEVRLAASLCARFPAFDLVRFTNSGTEANVMALTAARAFTGRAKVIVFRGGYHGSVLTFPVSGSSKVTLPVPFLLADFNDTEGTLALARENAHDLAAIIIEPMLGSGGCIPARPDFLMALRDVASETGALLILDEVMTSRMSAGGMHGRLGLTADMATLGKYVAGGMSFGAFGGRADVMGLFAGALPHAGTFNNNVLSMAAGRVAMDDIFTPEAAEVLWRRGEHLRDRLNDVCGIGNVPMNFTGLGSMATPHFRAGPIDRPYVPARRDEGLRELFFFDMLEAGIYIARRGMTALSLPVQEPDLERYIAAVAEFVALRAPLLRDAGA